MLKYTLFSVYCNIQTITNDLTHTEYTKERHLTDLVKVPVPQLFRLIAYYK